jgi:DNA-binding transcriptional LysR family regulator
MDSELLRAFLAVVEVGSFTRAGERLARTQSTISQQIGRLEQAVGKPLLLRQRASRNVTLTPAGEILVGYARRLLDISSEAQTMVSREKYQAVVRFGINEDIPTRLLVQLLGSCSSALPEIRLEVTSAWGDAINKLQAAKEIDLAIVRQSRGTPSLAARAERAAWVASPHFDPAADPVPLALFPHGCLYRAHATEALTAIGRAWHIAFTGQGVAAVQAAVVAGLGVAILSESTIPPGMRRLRLSQGFPAIPRLDLALLAVEPLSAPAEAVANHVRTAIFRQAKS